MYIPILLVYRLKSVGTYLLCQINRIYCCLTRLLYIYYSYATLI